MHNPINYKERLENLAKNCFSCGKQCWGYLCRDCDKKDKGKRVYYRRRRIRQ